ncbi:MAG: tetratricopeptide repeat protein [Candidatus Melainabacteria bacterium]|nr:tetratricopeptide repeat protein [Candidatus Melainabacteria bacterium]
MLDKTNFARIALTLTVATACMPGALADSISPSVGDAGKVYSTEKPDSSYFGTGSTAKLSEASHLRFKADQLITEGELDAAMKALAKAVQFDPQDPTGHLMLARVMTQKIKSNRKSVDWELYGQCIDEWTLLARHDADHLEQQEARTAIQSLKRMAKERIAQSQGKKPKRSMLAGLNPLNRFK